MKNTLFFLVVAGLCGCGTPPTPPPIYLGHVATTSGPARATGEQETLGIRLAIEELTRAGHERLGGRAVVAKHADARGQLEAFESQAVRLVTVSRVVALYGGNSPEEVLQLDRSRAPLLTPLGARPRGSSELVFCVGIAATAQAHALARFAIEEKAVKTMALLVDERREEARTLAESFEKELHKAFQEKYPKEEYKKPESISFGKEAKFADLAKHLDPTTVQGVLFAGSAQDYEEWRKTLVSAKFLIFFGGEDGTVREDGPNPAYLASAFAVNKDLPRAVEFTERFRDAFKVDPDVHAALAYEGIKILVEAMKLATSPTGDRFLEELRQTKDFPGLAGPLTFGADQQLRRPIFVGRMAGRALSVLKRFP